MKIALIGHGAMGQLVEKLASERNHEVVLALDQSDAARPTEDLSAELDRKSVV